jgi:hypothetical protein
MPTGYTAEIVDGKVTTFKHFAQKCMRAFGATIHMRDDSLDEKYKPRKVEKYYIESVEEREDKLDELKKADDQFFIDKVKSRLKSDYTYYEEKLRKVLDCKTRLDSILKDAKKWTPPTEEHTGVKDFMINQLEETIKYDADTAYYENELNEIKKKMESPIDISAIKKEMITDAEEELESSRERLREEIKRCDDSNKWVEQFLKSIE